VTFADGEEIRTEISAKFTREAVERELRAAGLRLDEFFTDGSKWFGLAFARAVMPTGGSRPRPPAGDLAG
jgi:L-histidine Nalpha-methyltransferase